MLRKALGNGRKKEVGFNKRIAVYMAVALLFIYSSPVSKKLFNLHNLPYTQKSCVELIKDISPH
jgi:hypothetical protein